MAISVFIFIVFSIYIMLKNYRSPYIRWLFIITASLSITITGLLVYISKFVNYYEKLAQNIKRNIILFTDYQIWVRLFNAHIGANDLTRLINISAAVFIYSVIGFSIVYTAAKVTRKTIVAIGLLALLPIGMIVFYDPLVSFQFFKMVNNARSHPDATNTILNLIKGIHNFNYIWVHLYFIYALSIIFIQYTRTRVAIKKNQILFVLTELLPISVIFLFIFIWMPVKDVDIYNYSIRLSFIPVGFRIPFNYFDFMPIAVGIFICINIYIIARFQVLNTLERNRQNHLKRSIKSANQNFRVVFHSFKNYIFAIKLLSDKMQSGTYDAGESAELAKEISMMCEEYMKKINILHSRLKDINIKLKSTNLVDMMGNIIKTIVVPEGITINYRRTDKPVFAYIDEFHFAEAARNIIINSIEAIGHNGGTINIGISVDGEWGIIQISDNGAGIRKEEFKSIFKPFFTTKNTKNNWGVGLSYAKSVIITHGGAIDVKSEYGAGTEFEIIIPVEG